MNPSASTLRVDSTLGPAARPRPQRGRGHDLAAALGIGVALALVGWVSRLGLYTARSETGYWMGVAGGVMMLLLFAYPLRKRWRVLAHFGKAKVWFVVHMALGVAGPAMVLAHSTLRIGSVNAGVALFSMLIVAASGVVGRFIYLRIHRGLGGERESAMALRARIGLDGAAVRRRLQAAPDVEASLAGFERRLSSPSDTWCVHLHRVFILPFEAARLRRRCIAEVRRSIARRAERGEVDPAEARHQARKLGRLIGGYVDSIVRVGQFAAFARLFSLWHLLHVPFVYLMVLCAIVHVVAVHAY